MSRSPSISLHVSPPFRLDLTAWALRRHPVNRIDRWDGQTYARTMVVRGRVVDVSVTQCGPPEVPRVFATIKNASVSKATAKAVQDALDRLLGLSIDLSPFYSFVGRFPDLNDLAIRFRGMKPPRFQSTFEALVNAICCQQISLLVGLTLLSRLAERYGPRSRREDAPDFAFPRPEDFISARGASLHALGLSRHKAQAIIDLAKLIYMGKLQPEGFLKLDNESAVRQLEALPGIGRWSAEYVLLRGLGRLNMFPGDDVGARKHLETWLHRRRPLDYEHTARVLDKWRPYAGLVYFHLLLKRLEEAGSLSQPGNRT